MSDNTRTSIRRVKKRVELDLLELPNVHALDIGDKVTDGKATGEMSIVVYVTEKKNVAAKSRVPAEIDGVKTDVQVMDRDVLHPAMTRIADDELRLDASRYATLEGGMSMGPCRSVFMEPPDVPEAGNFIFVGTLGAIVRDRSTNAPMALTNFHVACVNDEWSVGDDMAQPARNDGGSCPADRFGELQRAIVNDKIDAAVVSIEDRPFVCEILEIGQVQGSASAAVGMAVRKRGRTTELTTGEVVSTDYTTSVDYGDGIGVVVLTDQIRIEVTAPSTQFGISGDSGSVVVNADDEIVGLYFAGNASGSRGVANPIAEVLDQLDIDICTPKLVEKKIEIKEFKFESKEKIEKLEKVEKLEKPEKIEKIEKIEKVEDKEIEKRAETPKENLKNEIDKAPKTEKIEKIEKVEDKEIEKKFETPKDLKAEIEKAPKAEKPPRLEKDPIEKRPDEKNPFEKGPVEKNFETPIRPRQAIGQKSFDSPLKNFFDKPFPDIGHKHPKLEKDEHKELKNEAKEEKEIKELKDHKEQKEQKDHKEVVKDFKEPKELVEGPIDPRVLDPGGFGAAGSRYHFIPAHLRPDLSRGALRNEGS